VHVWNDGEHGRTAANAENCNHACNHAWRDAGPGPVGSACAACGASAAFRALPCASWLGRSTERYTGPWTARTSTPVLLLNTRYDPATPYRNAVLVHDLLPNSALLTVDGVGHGALLLSSCAQDATAQYLLTGALPPPGTVCAQDRAAFEEPPA
jgi:pimeloyl-ACP methyl ester carboxylesterase